MVLFAEGEDRLVSIAAFVTSMGALLLMLLKEVRDQRRKDRESADASKKAETSIKREEGSLSRQEESSAIAQWRKLLAESIGQRAQDTVRINKEREEDNARFKRDIEELRSRFRSDMAELDTKLDECEKDKGRIHQRLAHFEWLLRKNGIDPEGQGSN